jgi:hypothetical protein
VVQLRNIEDADGFDAKANQGHKVQIIGTFNPQATGTRINVGSAQSLSATCP